MAIDPAFVNERMPDSIERGAKGGPGFLTTVLELSSGFEHRNQEWERARQAWDIGYGMQNKEDYTTILDFFMVCAGRAHGFRFKDWTDYEIGTVDDPQVLGASTGTSVRFQAIRVYSVGTYSFVRKITRLVEGTVSVYDNGVLKTEGSDYTVDYDTGGIVFGTSPPMGHIISIVAEFDVPVRFDTDVLNIEVTWEEAAEVPQIVIKELKEG